MTNVISNKAVPAGFDLEVDDFNRRRRGMFETLLRELQKAAGDPEAADFGGIVSHAQTILNISDLDMSQMFKVSRPTVNRWTRRVTAPHPMLRKAVFDALLIRARQDFKALPSLN